MAVEFVGKAVIARGCTPVGHGQRNLKVFVAEEAIAVNALS